MPVTVILSIVMAIVAAPSFVQIIAGRAAASHQVHSEGHAILT
jgi:Tfp pilus assembly protein FimT